MSPCKTSATEGTPLLSRTPCATRFSRSPSKSQRQPRTRGGWLGVWVQSCHGSRALLWSCCTVRGHPQPTPALLPGPHVQLVVFSPSCVYTSFLRWLPARCETEAKNCNFAMGRAEISSPKLLLQTSKVSPCCPSLPTAAGDVAVRGRGCPAAPARPGDAAHRPRPPPRGAPRQAGAARHPARGPVRCTPGVSLPQALSPGRCSPRGCFSTSCVQGVRVVSAPRAAPPAPLCLPPAVAPLFPQPPGLGRFCRAPKSCRHPLLRGWAMQARSPLRRRRPFQQPLRC